MKGRFPMSKWLPGRGITSDQRTAEHRCSIADHRQNTLLGLLADFENCAERTESLYLPPFAGPDLPSFRSWAHAYPSVSRRAHRHCPTIHSTRRTRTDRPLSGPAPCCYGAPVRAGGAERGHEGGCRGARPRSPTLHCQSKLQKKWDCPTITLN